MGEMMKYIAFLRAINVGGHTVKMADLRDIFTILGFADVQTYIQSGNVLFTSSDLDSVSLEQQIETKLEMALGYAVPTFLRHETELIDIANHKPFADRLAAGDTMYISFLHDTPGATKQQALTALSTEVDIFHIYHNQVYWLYRRSLGESGFTNASIEKILGTPATRRNSNTIHKIVAKYLI